MDILEQYRTIHQSMTTNKDVRFMVFEPLDRTGWGNRLRGLTLAILMALATKRILVIKDFLIEEHFDPPEGCLWRYRDWRQQLSIIADRQTMDLHLQPTNWNQEEWESYATESMDTLFSARVVVLQESIGFFDQLIRNPHYQEVWKACGLDTTSKLAWLGQVTSALLERPTSRMRRKYDAFLRRLGPNPPDVLIQFRTFYDIGSPNAGLIDDFVNGVKTTLAGGFETFRSLYIATDSTVASERIGRELSNEFAVVVSKTEVVHTGALHTGWELFAERLLTKLFRRSFHFLDFWFWLPESWRPRPHTNVLAEWMYYGTCSMAFSTFTSFTVYAMARSGNQARLLRFDPQTRKFGPMTDDKYLF